MKITPAQLKKIINEEIQLARKEIILKEQQDVATKKQIVDLFSGLSVMDQEQLLTQLQAIKSEKWNKEHEKTKGARQAGMWSAADLADLRKKAGI